MVGFVFDTKETRAETGAPLDSIEKQLRGEVDEYDSYLRGEVYFWEVVELDEDGDVVEEFEAVHGYLGSDGVQVRARRGEEQRRIRGGEAQARAPQHRTGTRVLEGLTCSFSRSTHCRHPRA
jgi:hypothetical protein